MKRIGIVGLCLMAVFALSAMAASSASAAPGLLLARIQGGGSPAGVTFLSSGGLAQLWTHSGKEIHCKDVTNHGLFLSSTLGDLLIRFLGCTTPNPLGGERFKCNTAGAGTGEIHLPLGLTSFQLGLAHLTITVGRIPAALILLEKDVKIICGGGLAEVLVLGAVIGALRLDEGSHEPIPLEKPFNTALLSFEQTANGLQHLRLFLFEDKLNSYDLDALTKEGLTHIPAELASEVANALLDLFRNAAGEHINLELFEDK
jgi:hypothetical protein